MEDHRTKFEIIEDQWPQLKFYSIEVPSPYFFGSIHGTEVCINSLQPEIVQLKTMIHEAIHYEYDAGTSQCKLVSMYQLATLEAEGRAHRKTPVIYDQLFG